MLPNAYLKRLTTSLPILCNILPMDPSPYQLQNQARFRFFIVGIGLSPAMHTMASVVALIILVRLHWPIIALISLFILLLPPLDWLSHYLTMLFTGLITVDPTDLIASIWYKNSVFITLLHVEIWHSHHHPLSLNTVFITNLYTGTQWSSCQCALWISNIPSPLIIMFYIVLFLSHFREGSSNFCCSDFAYSLIIWLLTFRLSHYLRVHPWYC